MAGRRALPAASPGVHWCAPEDVPPQLSEPLVQLWLGGDAHIVHYPVKGGRLINVVVIMDDSWNAPGWSEPATRADLLQRFSTRDWTPQACPC